MTQILDSHPTLASFMGTLATFGSVALSRLEELTALFRCISAGLGVVTGVLTICLFVRNFRSKR